MTLPAEYCWEQRGCTTLAVLRSYRDRLMRLPLDDLDQLFGHELADTSRYRGRGGVASLPLDDGSGERLIVRRYRHGGLLRAVTGRLLLGPRRPFEELKAGHLASQSGVPTALVLAASVERRFPGLYRGAFFTKEIDGGKDLLSVLQQTSPAKTKAEIVRRREVVNAAAITVRAMHDRDIFHADLNLKNVVILQDGMASPEALMIDLDRARASVALSWRRRWSNLFRLDRSVEKLVASVGLCVNRSEKVRFLKAYLGRSLRGDREIRRRIRRHRLLLLIHRLTWPSRPSGARR